MIDNRVIVLRKTSGSVFLLLLILPWLAIADVPKNTSPRWRSAKTDPNVLADFRKRGSWHNTMVEAAARVSLLKSGDGELRIEVAPSSTEFKFFSEPHAAIVITNARGVILAQKTVTELAMAMGGVNRKHRAGRQHVESAKFRNAAYAFFRLKFCAWHMGFDRTVKASNGCFRSSIRREIRHLSTELPKRIGEIGATVGRPFELLGWQAIRLR